jgi:hypothetical protein
MALRRQMLPDPGDVLGLEERLLYFLYERGPQTGFRPLLDRDSDQLYRYPVAEQLACAQESVSQALEELRRRGLLRSEGLVDRTRLCSGCGSAHIHFVDVCPHCQSLDTRRESMLHCFACGHVGAESQFVEGGALDCPKCHVHLRTSAWTTTSRWPVPPPQLPALIGRFHGPGALGLCAHEHARRAGGA